MIETVKCPVCMFDAEVIERFVLESTDGPVEHIKILCPQGHGYRMPTALLFGLYEIGE